jgi:glycosyltransferase involved in cell wall biosynthesis
MRDRPRPGVALSLVIPAFNEDQHLWGTVRDCISKLDATSLQGKYELLVVNDGSSDRTGSLCERLAACLPQVEAVHRPTNGGMGAALRTGFERSRGHLVSLCPADGEFGVENVLHLYRQIGDAELIVSRRRGDPVGQPQQRPLHRELLSLGYHWLSRVVAGIDPARLSGLYMVRGDFLRQLHLSCKTGNLILEIYRHALRRGKAIRHTETCYVLRSGRKSRVANLATISKAFAELVRFRFHSG